MKHKVANFIMRCMNEMEADGYQTWEGDDGDVPDDIAPDDWKHDGDKTIWINWGGQEYEVVIKKKRAKKSQ